MKATYINPISGQFTVEINPQCESILSPDGKLQLIPCDHCKKLEWKSLNVVSFFCDSCSYKWKKGELIDIDIP